MKKRLFTFWLCLVMAFVPVNVMATSLDAVVQQNEVNGQTMNDNGIGVDGNSILDDVASKSDMTAQTEMSKKISEPLYKVASLFIQILFYIITLFLPVQCIAELGFLVLPIGRTGGMKEESNMIGQNNSMNSGMAGGMGGYGMNRGYGMGGASGMNRGYGMGGTMGMTGGMGGGMNAGQQPVLETKFLGIKVSENTVAIASSQVSTVAKLKEYGKDTTVKIIFSGVIAVLLVTGVLTTVYSTIGQAVANALANASGMI